jgi:hypothetical protein
VDPVTGLSRRASLGLLAAVVVGVVGGTVAQYVAARGKPGCPDRRYGCATIEPGEPIDVGALFPTHAAGRSVVAAARPPAGSVLGHAFHVVHLDGGCSAETAAAAAREFATDPPDGPPVVAVVGEACPGAEIPAAQILDDSGITFVSALDPAEVPGGASFYLAGPGVTGSEPDAVATDVPADPAVTAPAARAAIEVLLDAVQRVAVAHEGDLLVPRTQLRDALLEAGLSPASVRNR